jgi:hypothetical protein
VLRPADLQKLEGAWEMKVDDKSGWKGTIRLVIRFSPRDAKSAYPGRLIWALDLAQGAETLQANLSGIEIGGVKQADQQKLVTIPITDVMPLEINPAEEFSAPFTVTDDKMTLDLSKSRKHFCPQGIFEKELKLVQGKVELVKTKKK